MCQTMNVNQNFIHSISKVFLTAITILSLTQCTEDELLAPVQEAPAATEETATDAVTPQVMSLTITGVHTSFLGSKNCTTCTFIVPADIHIIDGKKFDFKPGSIICLDSKISYGSLEFINMEGTADNPIIIGGYGASVDSQTSSTKTQEEEAYASEAY
jgi:hypothetical protein